MKHFPRSVLENRPEIPWSRFARMRDRLSHGYFDIEYEFVWLAMTQHVPQLRGAIHEMICQKESEIND